VDAIKDKNISKINQLQFKLQTTMMSLPVEKITVSDLEWSFNIPTSTTLSDSISPFRKIQIFLHTEIAAWLTFGVVFSKLKQKPWIIVNGPPSFLEALAKADLMIGTKLEQEFPNSIYHPWINTTRFNSARFHISRLLNTGPYYLDIEEESTHTSRRVFGLEGIYNALDQQPLARLEIFEFFYIILNDNTIRCNPRLKKIHLDTTIVPYSTSV
jgi:hypothetical protein